MSTINKLVYGDIVLTDDEIEDGEAYTALALLADALEIGTLQVRLTIRDQAVGEKLSAFRRNDKLLYYHRDALRGTYYIERVQRTGKCSYELKANDAVALLEQSTHYGGIYTGQTVAQAVADICNIPYLIQTRFAGVRLYGWLPIATRRDNLIQVLFAVGANTKVDQDGALRIESLWDGVASPIPDDRVLLGDSVQYAARVTEVSVLEHQYIPGSETVDLFDGTAVEGDIIQFSEPVYDLSAEGFSILESGANYASLSAGTGKLTGKKYVHTTRDVRARVQPDDVPNVVEVKEATLVSLVNSSAVAQRLARYYACLDTLTHDIIHQGEAPGDVVAFEHPYGGAATGCIKDTAVALGSRPVATENVLVGYKPPKADTGTLDQRVVLTGTGEWVVPDEVPPGTTALVVLIGGGSGGWSGLPGEPGGEQNIVSNEQIVTNYMTFYKDVSTALGGAGGAPGEAGAGGKILQVNMTIDPGQRFSYSCGIGGKGGMAGEETARGEAGGDTEFGPYSSASGSRSPEGYMDVTTQEIFAADGVSGVAGGSGMGFQDGAVVPGSDVIYKGVTYKCGQRNSEPQREQSAGVADADYGVRTAISSGGFGGGAAAGANGADGGAPSSAYVSSNSATAYGGRGADGADAAAPEKPSIYGTGGTGGNGGGGGGIGGSGYTSCRIRTGAWGEPRYEVATLNSYAAERSAGGRPSDGSGGGDGCVLVFFGVPKTYVSGPVRDKSGKMVLDRLGRRIIV